MTGGKREREYTPEEAMAITLDEVSPHWYRSKPLIIGVNLLDKSYPQPLDPEIQVGTWIFFFSSPTSPEFTKMLQFQAHFEKRYGALGVKFILTVRGYYSFFNERKIIERWLSTLPVQGPTYCDPKGALARSFGSEGEPSVAILHEGQIAFSTNRHFSIAEAEECLQSILRKSSPGTPFWPPIDDEEKTLRSTGHWSLFENSKVILLGQVKLIGDWKYFEDRIVTGDSSAELLFEAPSSSVALVARSLSDSGDPTRVRLDTNGASFSDAFAGKDLVVDDEGNSSVVLGAPRAYSLVGNLPQSLRSLRLRFPFAKVSPVAIYGIEFGDIETQT